MSGRIVVTGASGFIGRWLVPLLAGQGYAVVEAGRRPGPHGVPFVATGDIHGGTEWRGALEGADAVVHLAGLAHSPDAPEADFFAVNDDGARRLAEQAAEADVRAIVHIGSIAARLAGRAAEADSFYGRSKRAGEAHVLRFAEGSRTGIVLRPPLVYGFDAPGNWQRLQRLAATGLPLPFGAVDNRRSLFSVENLCSAVAAALATGLRGAASGSYEIADEDTVSLAEMLRSLRRGMGIAARLVPVPTSLLRLGAQATGRAHLAGMLLDDLTVDPLPFMRAFDWKPPIATREGIAESGRRFMTTRRPGRR